MEWKRGPGDYAIWHGQLVELLEIPDPGNLWTVRATDAGGLTRDYVVKREWGPLNLIRPGEGVLDAMDRINQRVLAPYAQLCRLAELWLAALK